MNNNNYIHGLPTDLMANRERYLGEQFQTCKICSASGKFPTYLIREMLIPTLEEFQYFTCSNCECLQISTFPDDISQYYKDDYYSFNHQSDNKYKDEYKIQIDDYILDVGCGIGDWLHHLNKAGFNHLLGCDCFIQHDLKFSVDFQIKKSYIHEINGHFDFIRFSHSFEHMSDPHEVMDKIRRLLKKDGICKIIMPFFPNVVFDIYGPFWFAIDAPRHFFIHSKKSMEYLTNKHELKITNITHNSKAGAFIRSRFYQIGIPSSEHKKLADQYFTEDEQIKMMILTERANIKGTGDCAEFSIEHKR